MRYRTQDWIGLAALVLALAASAAEPISDEFTIPLQATALTAHAPARQSAQSRIIKDKLTQGPAMQAATAPAAIAAVVVQHAAGCQMIRFNTGFGWVATGRAQHPASENPVALRRIRQDARFKAFIDAYEQLASCLGSLDFAARQQVTAALEQNDAIRLALINLAFTEVDKQQQALNILLRGFVAYSVEEIPSQRTIFVNLVVTPKTAARLTRPAPNSLESTSLQEGLRQVQAEIAAGLIPPAGNRLIVVNTTGEVALIGYAINLVGSHPDAAAQQKLQADAAKIATQRATDALMALAASDEAGWQNTLDEATRTDIQTANSGYIDNEPSVTRFAQIRDFIMSNIKEDAGLEALRASRLPSAVVMKRLITEEVVAITAIYTPLVKKRETKPTPRATSQTATERQPAATAKAAPRSNSRLPAVPPTTTAPSAAGPASADTTTPTTAVNVPVNASTAPPPKMETLQTETSQTGAATGKNAEPTPPTVSNPTESSTVKPADGVSKPTER